MVFIAAGSTRNGNSVSSHGRKQHTKFSAVFISSMAIIFFFSVARIVQFSSYSFDLRQLLSTSLIIVIVDDDNHIQKKAGDISLLKDYFKDNTQVQAKADDNSLLKDLFNDDTIRSWGCNRNETPFIFVHIGKAGGGSVRRTFSASSVNFTSNKTMWRRDDTHYYPIPILNKNTTAFEHGKFCDSQYPNFRPTLDMYTYERTWKCTAKTPIGQAISCPVAYFRHNSRRCCDVNSEKCHIVYTGHNFFGSEMHWLPPKYLSKWWSDQILPHHTEKYIYNNDALVQNLNNGSNKNYNDSIAAWFASIKHDGSDGCRETNITLLYEKCYSSREQKVDVKVMELLFHSSANADDNNDNNKGVAHYNNYNYDWWKLYASMPVLRVTVMRDPFSWLLSKFFWHKLHLSTTCLDVSNATNHRINYFDNIDEKKSWGIDIPAGSYGGGWAKQMALEYILYICGEDCVVRYYNGLSNLYDIENQAHYNLKNSFAVVGLLNDTETFYKMVQHRVSYINTTLSKKVFPRNGKQKLHSSNKEKIDKNNCTGFYMKNVTFQNILLDASPEIAALQRLYNTAVEVNQFQLNEMTQSKCFS